MVYSWSPARHGAGEVRGQSPETSREAGVGMSGVATAVGSCVVVNGARYPVPPQGLRVGRAPDNDIVLADPNVSRQHVLIWSTPRGAFLRDLGSQNGTFIGARRLGLGPEAVPPGARVRVGQTELLIEQRPAAAQARPSGNLGLIVGLIALSLVGLVALTGWAVYRAASTPPNPVAVTPAPVAATPAPIAVTAAPTTAAAAVGPGVTLVPITTAPPASSPPSSAAATSAPPTAAPVAAARPDGRDPGLVRALNGAVRVLVPVGQNQASTGSGTVVTPRGHILTNHHVVSDNQGRLINGGSGIIIAVPPEEGAPAQPKFRARVVDSDARLDFALLRIVSMHPSGALPPDLGLTPVPIGDSDTVRIGDPLTIVGYPGLGGAGVTVTRGIQSGVQTFPDEPGPYFKTDTEINPGNSGGTTINAAGELVGVPTAGRIDRERIGKLGLIRPINLARPLIDKANQDR
jgi:S1-C subfamily serine protease